MACWDCKGKIWVLHHILTKFNLLIDPFTFNHPNPFFIFN